jgi:hypothetical protein
MKVIAHRGNVVGPYPTRENAPDYILEALGLGFDVEVDAWYQDGWSLGHDAPTYPVKLDFLEASRLWVHCKNVEALRRGIVAKLHCFYHTTEHYVLTSRQYIWAFPGQPGGERTICVLPEQSKQDVASFYGVCTDHPARYR